MPSPLASGAALIHAATLTGNLDDGWSYYEALKDNDAVAGGGNGDVLKQVAGGEKLYGIIVDFMPIREKAKGAPVEFVFPKEGVSAIVEPVAILKSTKNRRRRARLRRFPAVAGGPGLGAEAGLHRRAPGRRAAGRLSRAREIKLMALRRRKALADETRTRRPSPTSSASEGTARERPLAIERGGRPLLFAASFLTVLVLDVLPVARLAGAALAPGGVFSPARAVETS